MTQLATIEQAKSVNQSLIAYANEVQIIDTASRIQVEEFVQRVAEAEKRWDDLTGPAKKKAYESYQEALRLHDDPIKELSGARKVAKQKCIKWDTEQERIRREEERKLQEEARRQAEEEALAMAQQAADSGDVDLAEAILEAPVPVPPVRIAPTSPPPSRLTSGRSMWKAEVVDIMALVKAVAAGTQPITLIMANEPALNGLARSLKSGMNVPGVRAVETKV